MIRAIVSTAIMIWAGYWALQELDNPDLRIPIYLFGLGAILYVVFGIRKMLGYEPPAPKGDCVTVCLGLPTSPPRIRDFYRMLPDYCQRMIGQ